MRLLTGLCCCYRCLPTIIVPSARAALYVCPVVTFHAMQDNGVKLVDPRGEMLEASWEKSATTFANAVTPEALIDSINALVSTYKIDLQAPSKVVYGHDTRPSSPSLVKALEDGLAVFKGETVPAGLVTTPQLHYLVRAFNTEGTPEAYGTPTEDGYYEKLAKAFKTLSKGKTPLSTLSVDCANGVGAPKFRALLERIGTDKLDIKIVKDDTQTAGALNSGCGADYVKTQQKAPPGIQLTPKGRYCSFDGDADRIVFYYAGPDGHFRLLDGDKISGLAAMFLIDLVKHAGLELEVGVVQTAYANGSSTNYLTNTLVSMASTDTRRIISLT
jgi:phosphoacetylglucosamine mutase